MPRDYDWLHLIYKPAALKEQFPPLSQIIRDRPGTVEERAQRAFFHADNRRSITEARRRVREQEADAERFIREMRRRTEKKFLAHVEARQDERKAG